jgi:broad specificity phosphatase PhoE
MKVAANRDAGYPAWRSFPGTRRMIMLRHGQSEFNLLFTQTRKDPGIVDPVLTPLGHEQAQQAAAALAAEDIRRIMVSPYRRAIQTALPVARQLGLTLTVTPLVRERYAFTCDIGSPATELRMAFPDVDLSHIDEIWWPLQEEPADQVEARAALFRAEMAALNDWAQTLVVTHWGFVMALTGLSVTNGQILRVDPTAPGPALVPWKHH